MWWCGEVNSQTWQLGRGSSILCEHAHISSGHGGRDKMIQCLSRYADITRESIELFKYLCTECQKKRKRASTKGVVVRPILSKDFGSRAQVDLIDMQSITKAEHKWIMVYQDHLTKYCVLRPLTSKCAAEVAFQLMDIFLLLGAPQILQSHNGSEFTASVITELKVLWPISSWFTASLGILRVEVLLKDWTVMWKTELWCERHADCMAQWQQLNRLAYRIMIYSIPEKLKLSFWHQINAIQGFIRYWCTNWITHLCFTNWHSGMHGVGRGFHCSIFWWIWAGHSQHHQRCSPIFVRYVHTVCHHMAHDVCYNYDLSI